MKHLSLLFICVPLLHAEENLPILSDGYRKGEYTFSGTVTTRMGDFTSTHTFSGRVTEDTFQCDWGNDLGFFKQNGSVSVNGEGGVMSMKGMADSKFDDPEMAIASATGVSGGSAHLMYSLWKADEAAVFPTANVRIKKEKGQTVVSGGDGARTSVVTVENGIVVAVRNEYDPARDQEIGKREEPTDEQIKEILRSTNKPETEEEIGKIRKMLKDAEETMANNKDKILTETTVRTEGIAARD